MERVPANGTPEEVKRVELGTEHSGGSVQQDGQPPTGSWQWTVYPDGSADDGGIEFAEGAVGRSLLLSSDGSARWVSGGLPAQAPDHWPAGSCSSGVRLLGMSNVLETAASR